MLHLFKIICKHSSICALTGVKFGLNAQNVAIGLWKKMSKNYQRSAVNSIDTNAISVDTWVLIKLFWSNTWKQTIRPRSYFNANEFNSNIPFSFSAKQLKNWSLLFIEQKICSEERQHSGFNLGIALKLIVVISLHFEIKVKRLKKVQQHTFQSSLSSLEKRTVVFVTLRINTILTPIVLFNDQMKNLLARSKQSDSSTDSGHNGTEIAVNGSWHTRYRFAIQIILALFPSLIIIKNHPQYGKRNSVGKCTRRHLI